MDYVTRLNTRNKTALLDVMMDLFASAESSISFEGYLHNTKLNNIEGASESESSGLKRATTHPRLDFVVLPLTEASVPKIKKAIASRVGFGNEGIVHVQIQRGEQLAFAAYDGFHEDTVVLFLNGAEQLLERLVAAGVLRSYRRTPK